MFSLNDGLLFDRLDDPQLCAVIEGGRVVDLWTEDNSFSGLGSVHLVRVTRRFDQHKRLTGQLADGRAVSWQAKGGTKLQEGKLALVTVTAVARENKPVQAVGGIELAGRYVTLRWHGKATGLVHISRNFAPPNSLTCKGKNHCSFPRSRVAWCRICTYFKTSCFYIRRKYYSGLGKPLSLKQGK